jgi:uncharacterized RmlC-like cupin family protein
MKEVGDELFTRKAGELAFAPRGVPHTYANLSGAGAGALIVSPIPEVTTVGPPIGAEAARPGSG